MQLDACRFKFLVPSKMGLVVIWQASRRGKKSPGILVCRARAQHGTNLTSKSFSFDGECLMRTWLRPAWALACKFSKFSVAAGIASLLTAVSAFAQTTEEAGGEAALKLPDLTQVQFLGIDGHKLLLFGILFCVFGLVFGS